MSNRLHLTKVSRAAINDAHLSSTLIGEGSYLGPPCIRAKLGARDDPQPVAGQALVRFDRQVCLCLGYSDTKYSTFTHSSVFNNNFDLQVLLLYIKRWSILTTIPRHFPYSLSSFIRVLINLQNIV